MKRNKKLYFFFILIILGIDQILKFVLYRNGQAAIPENKGNNGYYILVSILAIILIVRYLQSNNSFIKKDTRIFLGVGLAGVSGNLIDRFFYGYVVVFKNLLNLNIAYIYIAITWIGMAWILAKNSHKFLKENRERKNGFKGK